MKRIYKARRDSSKNKISIWEMLSARITLIATCIAAFSTVAAFALNLYLVEQVRNDLAQQTVALNRQTVELDKVKTELAKDAQKTADLNALTNQAQLALMVRQTVNAEKSQNTRSKIDERTIRADEARLTPDYAKLMNDLRPALATDCRATRETSSLASIHCYFKNSGAFRVGLKITDIVGWDKRTNSPIAGKVKRFSGQDSNHILANGTGSNILYVELADNVQELSVRISYLATTDSHAIALTKKLSLGILGDKELNHLSSQHYNWGADIARY